jgi:hypothetical protein
MNYLKGLLSLAFVSVVVSACASSQKPVVILGENQIVELEGDRTCRVVKHGARNFHCVPVRDLATRPKRK